MEPDRVRAATAKWSTFRACRTRVREIRLTVPWSHSRLPPQSPATRTRVKKILPQIRATIKTSRSSEEPKRSRIKSRRSRNWRRLQVTRWASSWDRLASIKTIPFQVGLTAKKKKLKLLKDAREITCRFARWKAWARRSICSLLYRKKEVYITLKSKRRYRVRLSGAPRIWAISSQLIQLEKTQNIYF